MTKEIYTKLRDDEHYYGDFGKQFLSHSDISVLLKNHKEYAKKCNADYKVFVDDEKWLEFKKKYEQYQFDAINLYKIYVLEKLTDSYDNILYLDLDVIPNTDQSFFEVFDMNKINVHAPNAKVENVWSEMEVVDEASDIPEFSTLVMPIASVLGIAVFNYRRRKL